MKHKTKHVKQTTADDVGRMNATIGMLHMMTVGFKESFSYSIILYNESNQNIETHTSNKVLDIFIIACDD